MTHISKSPIPPRPSALRPVPAKQATEALAMVLAAAKLKDKQA